MDPEEQKRIEALQLAYDTTYRLYQHSAQTGQRSKLTTLFAIAGAIGGGFISPLAPMLVINAAFLYDTYKKREERIILRDAFNEVVKDMDPEARRYLDELDTLVNDVEDLNMDDINPVKQWEKKNYMGLGMVGFSLLFAFNILPGAIAAMAGFEDTDRVNQVAKAAVKAKEEMERIHPREELVPQP